MNTSIQSMFPFRYLTNKLGLHSRLPAKRQVGALCYRKKKGKLEVLLITSRDAGRWIIPKGWPGSKRSPRKQAEREAFEEAGILGKIGKKPLGEYQTQKGLGDGLKVPTCITVFPLKAQEQVKKFPEKGQRESQWMTFERAAKRCDDPGLRQMFVDKSIKRVLMDS